MISVKPSVDLQITSVHVRERGSELSLKSQSTCKLTLAISLALSSVQASLEGTISLAFFPRIFLSSLAPDPAHLVYRSLHPLHKEALLRQQISTLCLQNPALPRGIINNGPGPEPKMLGAGVGGGDGGRGRSDIAASHTTMEVTWTAMAPEAGNVLEA